MGAELIAKIQSRRTTGIEFKSPPVNWSPDASYAIRTLTLPGLLIEVSYSQNRKELKARAYDFILETGCRIRMVIGIDIEYGNTKAATYSVWRGHRPRNERGTFDFAVQDIATDVVRASTSFLFRSLVAASVGRGVCAC
jgi:hypothetical protein